ncbi:MAG: succinate dehydrogenase/fumarate reductase iron-sulfur subunit [Myxococcota bacterium]
MRLHLRIWRQESRDAAGGFERYELDGVRPQMSFLEMLDHLNETLAARGERSVAFDHDCREGICGQCGVFINGRPHGPGRAITTCQLHMRAFDDGDTVVVEPWRAKAFPVICDLIVDRTAFDRIIEAGGYVSVNTGTAPEANSIPVTKQEAEKAFDAAACIGCGACVAVCKNASAMLFVGAKVSHLATLPQGRVERGQRALNLVAQMEKEGFGGCTLTGACEAECPKRIGMHHIARLNYEYLRARLLRLLS